MPYSLFSKAHYAVYLSSAFALISCASIPEYVEPNSTDATAKVRVVHTQPKAYYTDIYTFDSPSCTHKMHVGWLGNNERIDEVRVGMLDSNPPSSATIERRFKANEPLIIGPRTLFPSVSVSEVLFVRDLHVQEGLRSRQAGPCSLHSFVPQINEEYEVVVDVAPGKCAVTPYRLVKASNDKVERQPIPVAPTPITISLFDLKCTK